MIIKFKNSQFTIPSDEQGLYSATSLSQAWAEAGGHDNALNGWIRYLDGNKIGRFSLISSRGRNGGTWVNKRGLLAFASYCSEEFEDAVFDAFDELTKGNSYKAAAIAESVAVSPELLDKYERARKEMNDTIKDFGGAMGRHAFSNYYRLACKGATGYVPSVLTGKNGSAKYYLADAECPEALTAVIAAMDLVSKGLKAGLDYHTSAFMLNVKTTHNGELFA
ncbi:TPA: KilA-N domain-containing protein [Aeromonas hydrophila]